MDGPRSGGPSRRGSTASNVERPYMGARNSDDAVPGSKRHSAEVELDTKRRRTDYVGNVAAIASHYNQRAEVGVEQREFSPIIGLKKFNNWVKSVLIGKFTPRPRGRGTGARVLDIGCGKGGDLNKWKQARISLYVGMDIAETSVDQARERWQTMRGNRYEAFFAAHDCYSNPIHEALPQQYATRELYDNVSMQFCMHYAFETPAKARMMMENVSRYLKSGGVFIGTIPNSALLL
jgi:mRNA (guanine-N7-)-methyltransferase